MALQTIGGDGLFFPPPVLGSATFLSTFSSTLVIDATGEKAALCGRVFFPSRSGTKTINKVQFRFGVVTKAGGSNLVVSLQNVATVFPMQPDETQDQFRAIANADIPASNNWFTSGLVTDDGTDTGAKRTVAFNEPLAVVLEFDGSGRQGSDSFVLSVLAPTSTGHGYAAALKTGGAWANTGVFPGVIFEFSDGSFGSFQSGYPCSAISSPSFKQDTGTADEYALEFQVPWPCKVDGAWFTVNTVSADGDFDVILYDGTTPMTNASVSFPGEYGSSNNQRLSIVGFAAEITLQPNYTYRLAFKPTQTTQAISVNYFDVANANHWTVWPGGVACKYTTRLDEGSWAAATATRRLNAGIRISALDDGANAIIPARQIIPL